MVVETGQRLDSHVPFNSERGDDDRAEPHTGQGNHQPRRHHTEPRCEGLLHSMILAQCRRFRMFVIFLDFNKDWQ